MSAVDRLRAALTTLHWSQRALAGILRIDERQVRRWAQGDYEPPPDLLAWLSRLAAFHEANPAPGGGGEVGDHAKNPAVTLLPETPSFS